jgi:hypothetical protein
MKMICFAKFAEKMAKKTENRSVSWPFSVSTERQAVANVSPIRFE